MPAEASTVSECFSIRHPSLFSFPASLLPGTGKRHARRIVHGSEFKVGHATNCNKYLARTRSISTLWGITCRIYIGTRFSSFGTLVYPASGSRDRIYSAGQPCATSNELLLYYRWLRRYSLISPPLLLTVSRCPPLRRKTGIGIAGLSRGAEPIKWTLDSRPSP